MHAHECGTRTGKQMHMHAHMSTRTSKNTHTCELSHASNRKRTHMRICTHTWLQVRTHADRNAHTNARRQERTHVHTSTQTHKHTRTHTCAHQLATKRQACGRKAHAKCKTENTIAGGRLTDSTSTAHQLRAKGSHNRCHVMSAYYTDIGRTYTNAIMIVGTCTNAMATMVALITSLGACTCTKTANPHEHTRTRTRTNANTPTYVQQLRARLNERLQARRQQTVGHIQKDTRKPRRTRVCILRSTWMRTHTRARGCACMIALVQA